jgi:hypothetical protein
VDTVERSTASDTGPGQTMLSYRRVSDLLAHRSVLPLTKVIVASSVSAMKITQQLKVKASAALMPPPPPGQLAARPAPAPASAAAGTALSARVLRTVLGRAGQGQGRGQGQGQGAAASLKLDYTHSSVYPIMGIAE